VAARHALGQSAQSPGVFAHVHDSHRGARFAMGAKRYSIKSAIPLICSDAVMSRRIRRRASVDTPNYRSPAAVPRHPLGRPKHSRQLLKLGMTAFRHTESQMPTCDGILWTSYSKLLFPGLCVSNKTPFIASPPHNIASSARQLHPTTSLSCFIHSC